MKNVMFYWPIQWRSAVFNIDTGKGRVRWFSKEPEKHQGWANKHKGRWYALWNSAAGLVFQVGDKRWDMKSFDCSHRIQEGKCIFEIRKSGKIEYLLEYGAPKDWLDALDIEMEDFFCAVSTVWNDPDHQYSLTSGWEVVEVS